MRLELTHSLTRTVTPAAQAAAHERSRLELEVNKLNLQLDHAKLEAREHLSRSPGKADKASARARGT